MAEQGALLGGRYQLGAVLGRGGMATVRRARDMRLGRDVAVKQLRLDLAGDSTFQARFRREAQASAGLNHPNIVAVYDTGEQEDQATGIEVPYIVMELVVGHTLRDVLREGRKILPARGLEMTMGVLDALQYSHNAGIIHRDIKPANVMLTSGGQVKVMDFGIARAVSDTAASMTQTAAVIGTAQYLSPEQARGEKVDNRSDVYAAGCLMYELLSGQPPFTGDSPVSVAYQHVREQPVPPSSIDPELTGSMDAIVLRSLAKDPADRYQSAKDMRDDIARLLAGETPVAVSEGPPASASASAETVALASVGATETLAATATIRPGGPARALEPLDDEPPQRRRGAFVAIMVVLALLLAGGVGAGIWWFTRPTPPPPIEQVSVPPVLSMTVDNAKATLIEARLVPEVVEVAGADDNTVNTVTAQSPDKGQMVDVGSTVTLTINIGPSKQTIPPGLIGQDKDVVKASLEKLGFTDVKLAEALDEPPTAAANTVTSVDPAPGQIEPLDTTITVYYATGRSQVPNLLGYTQDAAVAKAKDVGFANVVVQEEVSPISPGTVTRTDPAPDTIADRRTTVTIFVAKAAPTPTPTPTPSPSASASTSASSSPTSSQS